MSMTQGAWVWPRPRSYVKVSHEPFYDAVRNPDYIAPNYKIRGRRHGLIDMTSLKLPRGNEEHLRRLYWRYAMTRPRLESSVSPIEVQICTVTPAYWVKVWGKKLYIFAMHIILNQHHWFMPVRQFVGCFFNQSVGSLVSWTVSQSATPRNVNSQQE